MRLCAVLPSSCRRVCMFVCLFIYLSICRSVCLSACISHKPHVQIFRSCPYVLPAAVARSPYDAMQYVMYFRFCGWRCAFIWWTEEARIKDGAYVSSSSPDGDTSRTSDSNVVWSRSPDGGTVGGAKSAVAADFILCWYWCSGPMGATGATGPTGAKGHHGATGSQGDRGATGMHGADNANGSPGVIGAHLLNRISLLTSANSVPVYLLLVCLS